jgi:hypothetical protein
LKTLAEHFEGDIMTDYDKIKKLFNITKPKGFTAEELEVCKSKGIVLPQALLDYYKELGKFELSEGYRWSFLLRPNQLGRKRYSLAKSCVLVFYIDTTAFGSFWYGIKHEHLSKFNPPVYVYVTGLEDEDYDYDGWMLCCNSVQEFITAKAYEQSHFLHKYSSIAYYDLEINDLSFIVKNYKSKGIILTTYRSENEDQFDELDDATVRHFSDSSYGTILDSFGNNNHDDSARFYDIYQRGTRTPFHNNDDAYEESLLDNVTMYFGNYEDSVIVISGMSMHYSSLNEDHFLEMDKDLSTMKERVRVGKRGDSKEKKV